MNSPRQYAQSGAARTPGRFHPSGHLLQLAERNHVSLPAQDEEGLQDWYRFQDFEHFIQIDSPSQAACARPTIIA